MTTSVVVTTYNGIKYIKEQLDSIRLQSIKPNQVIISDDRSEDGTGEYVKEYIHEFELDNWQIIVRKKNLGWKLNFIETMKLADSDIILLADQDDIWESDKIERYIKAFENNDNALVITSNYSIIYEERDKTQQVFDRQIDGMLDDGSVIQWPLTKQFHIIDRPGCVFGVRRTFFQSVVKIYPENHPHDSFLWLASLSAGGLFLLQKKLIRYRRHANNEIKKKTIRNVQLSDRECYVKNEKSICENINEVIEANISIDEKCIMNDFIDFCSKRIELFESKNIWCWLSLFLRYRGYYTSFKSMLADLVLTMKNSA